MNRLAIVIPAYKAEFLDKTLNSFLKQTNKNFTIYVGDDASPYDIYSIVEKYLNELNIVYKRFENNLGSTSLTKQWERCIDLSSEPWIWLFSDDDVVSEDAVECFFNSIEVNNLFYKFHVKIIDEIGNITIQNRKTAKINHLSSSLSSEDFLNKRLLCKGYISYAVEYIFSRNLYDKYKFVDFPLAWSSDDATWLIYSLENNKTIKTINSIVYWRLSGANITSEIKNDKIVNQKIDSSKQYIEWLKSNISHNQLNIDNLKLLRWFSVQLGTVNPQLKFNDYEKYVDSLGLNINFSNKIYFYISTVLIIRLAYSKNRIQKKITKFIIKKDEK